MAERGPGERAAVASVAGRYRIQRRLGRGGMGAVYEVEDERSGALLALKRLEPGEDGSVSEVVAALFEREYHTLAELAHPNIVVVHDYGLQDGPYYTMELLEGATLAQARPAWRELCGHARDVCSALALIHSRRLIHRDVTLRNIQLTRDGRAKLIDFGVMMPMGATREVVGTPPCAAPEVLYQEELDGRVDLYALGASLYHGLTGRHAYPARGFRQLPERWAERPPLPSRLVEDLPPQLDALVMALLSLDRDARPATAGEVMERLTAIAELSPVGDAAEQGAYLKTPTLVGRDDGLTRFAQSTAALREGRGGAVIIEGPAGVGCTRMLDACLLHARLQGALVVRADAAESPGRLGAITVLAAELLEHAAEQDLGAVAESRDALIAALPGLERWAGRRNVGAAARERGASRTQTLARMRQLAIEVARDRPVCVAVDDLHLLDGESLVVLAALAHAGAHEPLLVLGTRRQDTQAPPELQLLRATAEAWPLGPLERAQQRQLLASVFGETPNLDLLAAMVAKVTAGNPGDTMALAEHLRRRGSVRYERGLWHIAGGLSQRDLPPSMKATLEARAAQVGEVARELCQLVALSPRRGLSMRECTMLLPEQPAAALHGALAELIAEQVLASEGERLRFRHAGWVAAFAAQLDGEQRRAGHRRLAAVFEAIGSDPAETIRQHILAEDERGLDALLDALGDPRRGRRVVAALGGGGGWILARALSQLQRWGRPPADEYRLLSAVVYGSDLDGYRGVPGNEAHLRAHLIRDTGLDHHRALKGEPPRSRVELALAHAQARHDATPEDRRVLDPQTAVGAVALHVGTLLPAGGMLCDAVLMDELGALVEPFVPLYPGFQALVQCARATADAVRGRSLQAHREFARALDAQDPRTRAGLLYAVAMTEATLGKPGSLERALELESERGFAAVTWDIRRVAHLNACDWHRAERCRARAEAATIEHGARRAFGGGQNAVTPLGAQIASGDLTGLKLALPTIALLADWSAGFVAWLELARGHYELARGDFRAGLEQLEAAAARAQPGGHAAWAPALAGQVSARVELGEAGRAVEIGRDALADAEREELWHPELARALALAESRAGQHAAADRRLHALLELLARVQSEGLQPALTHEARAWVALAADDATAFDAHARAAMQIYRSGTGPVLAARCQSLAEAAREARARRRPAPAARPPIEELLDELATQLRLGEDDAAPHDSDETTELTRPEGGGDGRT